jgi:hypothetical protein
MKLIASALLLIITPCVFGQVSVRSYTRENGAVVRAHQRTAPNDTIFDNYSYRGYSTERVTALSASPSLSHNVPAPASAPLSLPLHLSQTGALYGVSIQCKDEMCSNISFRKYDYDTFSWNYPALLPFVLWRGRTRLNGVYQSNGDEGLFYSGRENDDERNESRQKWLDDIATFNAEEKTKKDTLQ